jgi:putative membrane protein
MPETTDDTRLVTILLLIVGAFLIVPMVFMGFGMMGFGPTMGGMWGSGMWSGGTMPGWMFVVGIVMQLLFLVYRAVVGSGRDSDQAFEELRLAYARGEMTDEEYEQRRATLERDTE